MFPNTRVMKTAIHIKRWGEGCEDMAKEEEEEGRGSNEKRKRDVREGRNRQKRKRDMDMLLWSKFNKVKDLSHNVHSQILSYPL